MKIIYEPDMSILLRYMKQDKNCELLVHYPTVQAVEDEKIRELLEDFFVTTSSMREQKAFLDANFEKISRCNLPDCSELQPLFYRKNVVIVGAGSSVNGELDSLKKYRDNIMVFATGHIT